MTSITASNSATLSLTNFKTQALSGLNAASRTTSATPVAGAAPAATTTSTSANDAAKSTQPSKPQLSFNAVLTLQGGLPAKSSQGPLASALAAYGANTPKNQESTSFDTVSDKPAASSSKLTLADLNSEGANLVNLQKRTSLVSPTLSVANQAPQALLKLFS